MIWRWMIAICVWDEKTKLGQYRRYQSWDSIGEYRLRRKGKVKEMGFQLLKEKRGWKIRHRRVWNRREVRKGRLRVIRERKKSAEVRTLTSFERFLCERENFVFDYLIYIEPVERFKNRSNVMKFRSFGDSTSSRVKDKLKTICLCSR